MNDLKNEVLDYKAANIQQYLRAWIDITNDKFIIDIVREGLKVDFMAYPPSSNEAVQCVFGPSEILIIDSEINKLLSKKVIMATTRQDGDFLSSIFTRPKRDGSRRMILNLSKLNDYVNYNHFKMESLSNVTDIIKPNVWMASVDLKDAFYSIPVHPEHQKYFKFCWKGQYFQYVGMPNGYGPAMRIFTKMLKPPFSVLRSLGYLSVVYVDDTYLQGDTWSDCKNNVIHTVQLLRSLGFTIHFDKSQLDPVQKIEFLGFVIDSQNMTLKLSEEKSSKIKDKIGKILLSKEPTIRDLASVIGSIVAAFPAVPYGKLHYRAIEALKTEQLTRACGKFDTKISLNVEVTKELNWWLDSIEQSFQSLIIPDIDLTIHTDASLLGWGATDGLTPIGGPWKTDEIQHINVLELQAIYYALLSYCKNKKFQHIRIMSDNSTAVAYINNMGGIKSKTCDSLAKDIWSFAIDLGCWLSSAHIPGIDNTTADLKSRKFAENTEWQLIPDIFELTMSALQFYPDVDLFASRTNHQINTYVSWHPDPHAIATDAFTLSWTHLKFYAFPPFSIIGRVVAKIVKDQATGVIIVPNWSTQYWYPSLLSIKISEMIYLPEYALRLQSDQMKQHPLLGKLRLMAVLVSGRNLRK